MRDADMPDDLLANLLTGAHRLDDLDAGALAFGIMFGADEHVRECSRTSRNRNHQLPLGALLCPPGSQGLKLNKKTPDKPTKPTNSGKGTGRWSVIEALHLGAPASMMQAAVEARNISADLEGRVASAAIFGAAQNPMNYDFVSRPRGLVALHGAMIAAKICAYTQGFEVLRKASEAFEWDLDLAAIARVWRAGCIIRSVLLDDFSDAFEENPTRKLSHAPKFTEMLKQNSGSLQATVAMSIAVGMEVPALSAAFSYFNSSRQEHSTANMIQGLRDRFGAHTFERVDAPGEKVNGPWHDTDR